MEKFYSPCEEMYDLKENLKKMTIEQLDARYCESQSSIVQPLSEDEAHVSSLIIYPVKSCMGFVVKEWTMCEYGLYLDRHWCIKSLTSGRYLGIHKSMESIIIHPYIDVVSKVLILAAVGMNSNLILPINDDEFLKTDGSSLHELVMMGESLGYNFEDCGDEAANWINQALNMTNLRLLRQVQLRKRNLTLASDSHIQLMNISSLEYLSEEIAQDQGFMNTPLSELCLRFRPNIVVGGLNKDIENQINEFSIRGIKFKCEELVERCKAVNLDLQRYDYESYPLKYLLKAGEGKAFFGVHTFVNLISGNEVLRVGDKLVVHSYKETASS